MAEPRVSVIVPSHNAGRYLADCVRSVLGQSEKSLELLLVDDGSSDGSVERVASDIRDPRLQVIRQRQGGAASARNAGLARASGHWLCFLDADDVLASDKLGSQLSYLAQQPDLEICAAAWQRFFGRPPERLTAEGDDLWQAMDPVAWQCIALRQHLMMHPAAWLVRRDLVSRAGGWNTDLSLNDDGEFFARQMLASHRVGFCPDAVSFYRSGMADSLSAARSARHLQSALLAMKLIAAKLLAREDSGATREALALAYSRLAVEAYPRFRSVTQSAIELAESLGSFSPQLEGGFIPALRAGFGWRVARTVQWAVYAAGYGRLGVRRLQRAEGADRES